MRLGIDAPRSVAVHRQEIYRRIQAEQNGAASEEPPHMVSMHIVSANGEVRAQARKPTEEL